MSDPTINIQVIAQYVKEQSNPDVNEFVFAYSIKIQNSSKQKVQLISRYWQITDANNDVQEVQGLGVVGEQPELSEGQSYQYTSGAVLKTNTGTMEGHYIFTKEDNSEFTVPIPPFMLAQPNSLH